MCTEKRTVQCKMLHTVYQNLVLLFSISSIKLKTCMHMIQACLREYIHSKTQQENSVLEMSRDIMEDSAVLRETQDCSKVGLQQEKAFLTVIASKCLKWKTTTEQSKEQPLQNTRFNSSSLQNSIVIIPTAADGHSLNIHWGVADYSLDRIECSGYGLLH